MIRYANRRREDSGLTLIEVLVVIIIIAILAVLVVPRLLGVGRKAKEANLRGQLHQLRNAIQLFEAHCGDYPAELSQLMDPPADGDTGGTGIPLEAAPWQGPYVTTSDGQLPEDPFTNDSTSWGYDPPTGHVASGSTLTSLAGEPYSSW